MLLFKGIVLAVLLTNGLVSGWLLREVREDSGYSCFPWIFNPGCPLARLVNWSLVCRTNTLGWEMCDHKKAKEEEKKKQLTEDIPPVNQDASSVLHELADIEDERETYAIIDQLVDEPQGIIELSDVILTDQSKSPESIAQQISNAVNASIQELSEGLDLETTDIEFEYPSVLLDKEPVTDPSSKLDATDNLDAIVDEIFRESVASGPEVFKVEGLKPLTYKLNPLQNTFNIIQSTEEVDKNLPEIIPLRPFKHIVKVIKHRPDALQNSELKQPSGDTNNIIDPRISPFMNVL